MYSRSSIKFHALLIKSSIQEKLGNHKAAEQTMEEARQIPKDISEKLFKSDTTCPVNTGCSFSRIFHSM